MAYTARGRDPLLDTATQAFIEKRGREALGALSIVVALVFAFMISGYSAQDSAGLVSGAETRGFFGQIGAALTAPLMKILGFGVWALPLLLAVWGLRFLFHFGSDRFVARIIYAPVILALASVYAATLPPSADWMHSFSMGGLFGDTVLYMLLQALPGSAAAGSKIVALVLGISLLALFYYVGGFVMQELRLGLAWASYGVSFAVAWVLWRLRRPAPEREPQRHDPMFAPQQMSDEAKRVASVIRANPVMPVAEQSLPPAPQDPEPEAENASIFARMPSLLKRASAPETDAPMAQLDEAVPQDDRIRAKINSAIKSRVRPPSIASSAQTIQQATQRAKRPEPMVLPTAPQQAQLSEPDNIFLEDETLETKAVPFTMNPIPDVQPTKVVSQPIVQHPTRKPVQPSRQAQAEAQPSLQFAAPEPVAYEAPPLGLLMDPGLIQKHVLSDDALEQNARMLESVLDDYGVKGEIVSVRPGPVVTMYELEPAPGLKASRVIGLADDIARSMSALAARVSTVPGRSVIGIELPNENREMVVLRELLSGRDFGDGNLKLPLALGKDISGAPIVANLAKMPHLLIAGTTGSGKSVAINTMILSLLYKLSPDDCRLIMIDPKMLELSVYDGIPHLLSPVVTDPKKAVVALKWVVGEMEDRYRKMSKMGVRNIDGYNSRVADALAKGEMFSRTVQTGFDDATGEPLFETEEFAPVKLPYIVVVVDEMADLMMVAGKEIEACIQRLAQMARASGIHLIMATQRPSVDVITGTIKANFPTRISFQVTSKVDSRTILGEMGAEQLLGMGDMLYMAGGGKITRVHGPFCSDEEVEEIVTYLKSFGPPEYIGGVVDGPDEDKESNIDAVLGLGGNTDQEDALYDTAVQIVIKDRKCSTSYIQRKLAIGYNKAARLVEQMEDNGLVSPANHVGKREILVPEQG